MTLTNKPKLIVILGPTATGKTPLGVALAKKFNGEIVSADSRQVYKGMDIGTGKDLAEYGKVKYHCVDVVKPNTKFNLAKYKKLALKAIADIHSRGKIPFLVGGTGLYISAIVDNYQIPKVKPDKLIRKKLDNLSLKQKQNMLKKMDKQAFKNIDLKNPRRLDRALEVCLSGQKFSKIKKKNKSLFDILQLGLTFPREKINQRIDQRVESRLKQGMIKEVKKLHEQGVSWKKMEEFGLEYRFISRYLRNIYDKQEMKIKLKTAIHQFAKRQMTWMKRDKKIHWIKNKAQAEGLIKKFLKK